VFDGLVNEVRAPNSGDTSIMFHNATKKERDYFMKRDNLVDLYSYTHYCDYKYSAENTLKKIIERMMAHDEFIRRNVYDNVPDFDDLIADHKFKLCKTAYYFSTKYNTLQYDINRFNIEFRLRYIIEYSIEKVYDLKPANPNLCLFFKYKDDLHDVLYSFIIDRDPTILNTPRIPNRKELVDTADLFKRTFDQFIKEYSNPVLQDLAKTLKDAINTPNTYASKIAINTILSAYPDNEDDIIDMKNNNPINELLLIAFKKTLTQMSGGGKKKRAIKARK